MVIKFHEKLHESKSHLDRYGKLTLIAEHLHCLTERPDLAMNFKQVGDLFCVNNSCKSMNSFIVIVGFSNHRPSFRCQVNM